MTEWRWIPGYENRYEVSDDGQIRSHLRPGGPHPLSRGVSGEYFTVGLCSPKKRTASVHALVALAFIGPRPQGMVIRHLDGDSFNNSVENLAYGTTSENAADTLAHGRNVNANKTHCAQGHPYDDENTRRFRTNRACKICNRIAVAKLAAKKRLSNPVEPHPSASRTVVLTARQAAVQVCARGHERSVENTLIRKDGSRECRICKRDGQRERRKAAAILALFNEKGNE